MTDATRLSHLLDDYAAALATHLGTVKEEFGQLERAWSALSEVYEGAAADQFRNVFESTAGRMQRYEDDAAGLLTVLRARIETLRRFDATQPEL
ncbi:MAG: hypothetical protein KIT73_04575 [Burkholderiales bacterium]|nr:hypothetical protein [Burkholderiales bacterium]